MFNPIELDFIRQAAKNTKNQGELAVAKWINDLNGHWYGPWNWSKTKLNIIQFCAEECKRQHSGEMSVYDMIVAWDMACERLQNEPEESRMIDLNFIEWVGQLVEPIDNALGFRTIPIFVGNGFTSIEKAPWDRVPELLTLLLNSYYSGDLSGKNSETFHGVFHPKAEKVEDQFYYEFENIHPFRDGNGRSGKILYNYLCGTLENPIMPPNFWGSNNP